MWFLWCWQVVARIFWWL